MTPAPSNLRNPTIVAKDGRGVSHRFHVDQGREYEWMRADPGYDQHRPLSRDDIGSLIRMIPAAIVVVAGALAFMALLIALVPAPVPA